MKLLLIENDPGDAELCLLALGRAGFELQSDVVQSRQEFRAKLDTGDYDVILSDYNLPGWSGTEAFEYLQGTGREIPFILVTGAIGDEIAVECIKRGIADYVLKDRLDRLPVAIQRAVHEKQIRRDRARAEEEVRRLNQDLELRVEERTAQLEAANRELRRENAERRRAEEVLRESQERFQLLVDGVQEYAIYMLDPDGRVVSWNAGAERIKGYRAEEALGMHFSAFYPQDQARRGDPRNHLEQATTDGRLEFERWRMRKDGSLYRANTILTPVRSEAGDLKGFAVISRDITATLRAQQALDELRQQQALILDSAGEGICGLDRRGRCTFINLAGAKMLGWAVEELHGKYLLDALHPPAGSDGGCSTGGKRIQTALERGKALHGQDETFCRQNGTSFATDYMLTPIRNGEGQTLGAVLVFRDITERKTVERMKDEFISVISHELRTPLTAVRAVMGLLASGKLCQTPGECQKIVATGMANADRLVRLVNEFLDLERIESGQARMEKSRCDAARLFEELNELMRVSAEAQDVRLIFSRASGTLWADPDRILQVLINLVGNAIKFSPRGAEISIGAERKDGEIAFSVKDQGRGIPKGKTATVFERFQQVDASDSREKGGTGLGLAISRSIVAQHGGRIWVESEPGRGSTFFFALPAEQEPSARRRGEDQCPEES
ncbi:MAG: PAS domain S-box protein [Terriglobia bacterium]